MSKWWTDFAKCVSDGDNDQIMRFFKKITTKNAADTHDREKNTLLHYISRTNNVVIASYLISIGCDINAKNYIDDPPLVEAIKHNSIEIVKLLVNKGVNLSNTYYANECGPLHKSAKYGYYDVFDVLLKAGCKIEPDKNGYTVLHFATLSTSDLDCNHQSRHKLVESLIHLGLDVNANTENKCSPLHFASGYGTNRIAELLLSSGARLEAEDHYKRTPLIWASMSGNTEVASQLLKAGAVIEKTDSDGMTSLHYSIHNLHPKMVKLLLGKGAAVNIVDSNGISPLWRCLSRCCLSWESTKCLNKLSDEAIERDFSSTFKDQIECLKLLLEHDADIDSVTHLPNQITPIYSALFINHSKVVNLLLKHNATFDYEHKYGCTAITRFNSQESKSIKLLLRHTAKFEAQNRNDGPVNFKREKLKRSLQTYYAQCRDELELMKTSCIYSTVTFFNILVDSCIQSYVRNEQVIREFESLQFRKRFPIYFDSLNERYEEELERQEMIEISLKKFSRGLGLGTNYIDILFRNVFSYLSKRDLRILVQL